MRDNITLNINGKEVIIPDRSEDKWKAMAVHLWKYLHSDMAGYIEFYVRTDRGGSMWKKTAIKLYERAMKGI